MIPPAPHLHRLLALVETGLHLPAGSVRLETPIAEIGDSLDWLELMGAIEDDFGVPMVDAPMKQLRTVGDLLPLLAASAAGLDAMGAPLQRSVQGAVERIAPPLG